MTTAKYYINAFEDPLAPEEDYLREITVAEYDELAEAVGVIDALWSIEEYYDNLLQNAVDFETARKPNLTKCIFSEVHDLDCADALIP